MHTHANIIVSGIIICGILIDNKWDTNIIINGIIKISGIIVKNKQDDNKQDRGRAGR